MPRIVELPDDTPLHDDLECYFRRGRRKPRNRYPAATAANATAATPPTPIPIDATEISAATLRLLRPGALTDTQPLAISQRLTNLLIVTPAESIAYVQIFQSFASTGLVSSGRKYA
ncbi:hypothetical protein HK102_006063 [Quaeritorhiza haematococci]|nr:hypothetical protein HK102_006063 [Quaeritorhiza haematococci]